MNPFAYRSKDKIVMEIIITEKNREVKTMAMLK